MSAPRNYVRLSAATLTALAVTLLMAWYSEFSWAALRHPLHGIRLPDEAVPGFTRWFHSARWYVSAVPASVALVGVFGLRTKAVDSWICEAAIGFQWMFVAVWVCVAMFVWRLREVNLPESIGRPPNKSLE